MKDQSLHEGFGFRRKSRVEYMTRAESTAEPIAEVAKRCETTLRRERKDTDPEDEEKDILRGALSGLVDAQGVLARAVARHCREVSVRR